MEVITWTSADYGAVARIRMPMPAAKGGTKLGWSPVVIHADTEAEARQKAQDFYRSEVERFAKRADGIERRIAKAAETRAAKKGASQ